MIALWLIYLCTRKQTIKIILITLRFLQLSLIHKETKQIAPKYSGIRIRALYQIFCKISGTKLCVGVYRILSSTSHVQQMQLSDFEEKFIIHLKFFAKNLHVGLLIILLLYCVTYNSEC